MPFGNKVSDDILKVHENRSPEFISYRFTANVDGVCVSNDVFGAQRLGNGK